MSQPLPHPDTTLTSCNSNAYSEVYDAQGFSQTPNEKLYSRIVDYLLIYYSNTPYLADQIHRTPDESAAFELGEHYLQLFRAFRRHKPTHSSRPSVDDDQVSGRSRQEFVRVQEGLTRKLVSTGDDGEGASKGETGSALGILKAFWITMGDTLVQKDGIHNPRNVMTLWLSCREDLNTFFMWFEPTGVKHQYRVCHFMKGPVSAESHEIATFKVNDAVAEGSSSCIEIMKDNPDQFLPDPKLLALHAKCARVARISEAAKILDEWDQDLVDKFSLLTALT
ncbi:hypothetical protein VNI00_010541 [Paramarasmius palmivorus]|uniref:HNH nuclease domain-containing protein n=1 Tax=Paramarasmius palmivorus TaxID=297713 RepID=A0AAW0CKW1_9AGAR